MALFPPDSSLLFPQFESYRLQSLDPSTNLAFHPLPQPGATQSRMEYNQQHLSFKEMRARISWDHLTVGEGGRGVYIDKEWAVIGFTIQASISTAALYFDDLSPVFTRLANLPRPISSTQQRSEFSSVLQLDSAHWAVSTGSGSLYILQVSALGEPFIGELIARYDLRLQGQSNEMPFILRSSHAFSLEDVRVLITRSVYPGERDFKSVQETTFELLEIGINPLMANGIDDAPSMLDIKWSLSGRDLPVYSTWHKAGWVVLAETEFQKTISGDKKLDSDEEGRKRERDARIGKLGLGASLPPEESVPSPSLSERRDEPMDVDERKDYPYLWTQNHETVNVTIPIPSSVNKGDINISFTTSSFTFFLSNTASSTLSAQLVQFLSKSSRPFWSDIDPGASNWTWDPARSIIELDLQKKDEIIRWPSVFSTMEDGDDEDGCDEVPETISESLLAEVRETFNNIRTLDADEPELAHPAMPALLREEMDFDLDDGEDFGEGDGKYAELGGRTRVGRDVLVGYIQAETGKATWNQSMGNTLSLPLSGSSTTPLSLVVKYAVDGLIMMPKDDGDEKEGAEGVTKNAWNHVSTHPALAFVISSKRDIRLIRHIVLPPLLHTAPYANLSSSLTSKKPKVSSYSASIKSVVFAFDSGSSTTGQGNLYVYYPPTSEALAHQGVLPLSGGEKGALLGVGAVQVGEEQIIVALCEEVLVVLKSIL
nr:hypothetical protein L203_05320 [Cryptococcus depauperatus CBS 7841]